MKKPIALVMSDTHLKERNQDLIYDIFDQAIEYCLSNDIKTLIHAGDFFDHSEYQSISVLLTAQKIRENLIYGKGKKIVFLAISGNHDTIYHHRTDQSFVSIFFKSQDFYEHQDDLGNSYLFYLLPFYSEEIFLEKLEDLRKRARKDFGKKKILITHQGVNGVLNNDMSAHVSLIKPHLFTEFDAVLVGHYHNRQFIEPNIHYIGSTHQANFGEDENKGFCVVYEDGGIEFVPTLFPKYKNIKIKATKLNESKLQEIEKSKEEYPHLRLTITGTQEECLSVNVNELKTKGINVKMSYDIVKKESLTSLKSLEVTKETLKKEFIQYSKETAMSQEIRDLSLHYLSLCGI